MPTNAAPPVKGLRRSQGNRGQSREWVAVKHRWGLKVDSAEKASLTRLANSCPNVKLAVMKV